MRITSILTEQQCYEFQLLTYSLSETAKIDDQINSIQIRCLLNQLPYSIDLLIAFECIPNSARTA